MGLVFLLYPLVISHRTDIMCTRRAYIPDGVQVSCSSSNPITSQSCVIIDVSGVQRRIPCMSPALVILS